MWKSYLAAFAVTLLTAALLLSPEIGLKAAVYGMDIWWKTVFPSLLPFFILTELLAGLGVIAFFGSLTGGIMQFFFRVPGPAGVGWILSLASGFPSGARIAAHLRNEKLISQIEAERLVAFAHSSNPLFILSAVASGFLHDPDSGFILAFAHYSAAFLVGITMRFYGGKSVLPKVPSKGALQSFKEARRQDGRAFGTMLADAVISSVQTLMLVGGFIIFFSILMAMLKQHGVVTSFSSLLTHYGINAAYTEALLMGFFELTSGAQQASSDQINREAGLVMIAAILGFSGLSVHAQVAAVISKTDIRYTPFLAARFLHSFYAVAITLFLLSQPSFNVPFSLSSFHPERGMILTVFSLAAASFLLGLRYQKSRRKRY